MRKTAGGPLPPPPPSGARVNSQHHQPVISPTNSQHQPVVPLESARAISHLSVAKTKTSGVGVSWLVRCRVGAGLCSDGRVGNYVSAAGLGLNEETTRYGGIGQKDVTYPVARRFVHFHPSVPLNIVRRFNAE